MPVAFDFETWLIQPGVLNPPVVCGAFFDGETTPLLEQRPEALERVRHILMTPEMVIGANVAYDFGCHLRHYPEDFALVWKKYDEGKVFDILIACTLNAIAEGRLKDGELFDRSGRRMVDPGTGKQTNRYTLACAVKEWLGRDDAKENAEFRLRYAEFDGLPFSAWPANAIQYPKDDAVNTFEVARAMLPTAMNLHEVPFQSQVALALHLSAINGLRTDPEKVAALKGAIEARLGELRQVVVKAGLMKSNRHNELSKNMAAIREAVQAAWLGQAPVTEKGQVSTAREVLEDSGSPPLQALGELSKWEKLSTYVPALEEAARAPLNVRPNVILATGRTSYEGLVQLMPRKGGVRECFKFRGVGSSVDYSAIELSTLAQVCLWTVGGSKLADIINAGQDPHSIMGASLTGVSYEEFRARIDAKDAAAKDLRQAGKAANFGFPGGMGEEAFVSAKRKEGSSVCEWFYRDGRCGEKKVMEWKDRPCRAPACLRCLEQTRELRGIWFATLPEMRSYLKWVDAQLQEKDSVEQFVSHRIRGGVTYTSAANTLFQGLAADGAKRAVVQMTREMYGAEETALTGSRLCIFAHDETIIDIPDRGVDFVDAAARRQAEVMVAKMREVVPDVRVSAEPALMRYWTKEADKKLDEKGRLIPWG
jgi:DNA polymerase-1